MQDARIDDLVHGIGSGLAAGVLQVMVGKAEEKLLLPPGEDADIAPRLVRRLAEGVGERVSPPTAWVLGTAFHFGYAAFWGAVYALARERFRFSPVVGGAILGGLIYGITFPSWGGAVQTEVERPPEVRSRRMTFVALSVAAAFGMSTAMVYERFRNKVET